MNTLTPTLISTERCEYHGAGLRFIFTDMTAARGGIYAWVEVRWQGNIPDPRPLAFGTYNLMGNRTISTLTSEVFAADPKLDKPQIRELVTDAINDVRLVYTEQHDAKPLHETPTTLQRWTLKPLLEAHSVTRLIAAGGSLKSLLALAICATVASGSPKLLGLRPQTTGPGLYLDWEADAATHSERLRAVAKAAGIPTPENIHYMRMSGALHLSQRRIASAVADIDPVLIVVDSNAMARGVSGDGSAEDSTIRMFAALRSFQRSSLVVDHKSDEKARRGLSGGYGSIFNRNLARLEWEVNRAVQNGESTDLVLRLEKANNMRRGLELGYRITIKQTQEDIWETAKIDWVNPQTIQALAPSSSSTLADRVAGYLSHQTEAQTVKAIAAACHLGENAIRSVLNRDQSGRFENVGTIARALWRLADQDTDEGQIDSLPNPF